MGNQRHTMAFLMMTIALDSMSMGIVIPVMVDLFRELTSLEPEDSILYGSALIFVVAFMQFFFAPILGNLSDRYGRRPVLLISLSMLAVDHLLVAIAPTITLLFVARLLTGISSATFPTANALVADITPAENRVRLFGLLGGAWGVGFIIGPLLGGVIGEYGPRAPFYAAAVLAGINAIYGAIVLPETLSSENRRAFNWKRANPVGALLNLKKYPALFPLIASVFFFMIAHDVNPGVWVFYVTHKFGWESQEIGYSLALVGVSTIVIMSWLVGVVNAKLGEYRTAYIGFGMGALGYIGMGLATQGWMMYAIIPIFSLFSLGMPAVRGLLSAGTPANAQGDLQGSVGSVSALATVLTPLMVGPLFNYFSQIDNPYYFPGVAHVLGAFCLVLAAAMVWISAMRNRRGQVVGDDNPAAS